MTSVEGQIEPLKRLKETLNRSGITRFNSLGEIDRFIKNYETERKQLPSLIESALDAEIQDMHAALARQQQIYEELKADIGNEISQKAQELEIEITKARDKSRRNLFYRIVYFLIIKYLSHRRSNLDSNFESILKKKTSNEEAKVAKLKIEIADCLENKMVIFLWF